MSHWRFTDEPELVPEPVLEDDRTSPPVVVPPREAGGGHAQEVSKPQPRFAMLPNAVLATLIAFAACVAVVFAKQAADDAQRTTWAQNLFLAAGIASCVVVIGLVVRRILLLTISKPAPAEASVTVEPDSQRREPRSLTGILMFVPVSLALVGALAILMFGWGTSLAGTRPAAELAVGDCFDKPTGTFDRVTLIDCAKPHQVEIYAVFQNPAPAGAPYPGMDAQGRLGYPLCFDAFERFTGLQYSRTGVLLVAAYMPEEPFWDRGIRTINCSLYRFDLGHLTGSARR